MIARVLAIPQKRYDKATVAFLTAVEVDALLAAPDPDRWEGRRDQTLLTVVVQTGVRVSELTGLDCGDITIGTGAHLRCEGKGRKQRAVPLTASTVAVVRNWLAERAGLPADPLFCTRTGRRLSRDAVERRVTLHATTAAQQCPSLRDKRLTPHVLRHTAAMTLLHAGVDTSVIALWLGHRISDPPRCISTPISPSRNKRSPAPPRRRSRPAATGHQTRSSPSSRTCDYADPTTRRPARRRRAIPKSRATATAVGITAPSA